MEMSEILSDRRDEIFFAVLQSFGDEDLAGRLADAIEGNGHWLMERVSKGASHKQLLRKLGLPDGQFEQEAFSAALGTFARLTPRLSRFGND
jgi:hypothetical protein